MRSLDDAEAEQVLARGADVAVIMDKATIDGNIVGYIKDLIAIDHGPGGMSAAVVDHYQPEL